MSLGGFAASAIAIPVLWTQPAAGRARDLGGVRAGRRGVVATLATELPPFFRVLRGAPLPRGFVYRDDARQGA